MSRTDHHNNRKPLWDQADRVTRREHRRISAARRVARAKAEILEDITTGRVPSSVSTFSELHDYVDANEYGGLCEDDLWPEEPDEDPSRGERMADLANEVQGAVDVWLRAGRPVPVEGETFKRWTRPAGSTHDVEDLRPGDLVLIPLWTDPQGWVARRVQSVAQVGSDRSRTRVTFATVDSWATETRTYAPLSTLWKVAES